MPKIVVQAEMDVQSIIDHTSKNTGETSIPSNYKDNAGNWIKNVTIAIQNPDSYIPGYTLVHKKHGLYFVKTQQHVAAPASTGTTASVAAPASASATVDHVAKFWELAQEKGWNLVPCSPDEASAKAGASYSNYAEWLLYSAKAYCGRMTVDKWKAEVKPVMKDAKLAHCANHHQFATILRAGGWEV